jgi:hypothetical protein
MRTAPALLCFSLLFPACGAPLPGGATTPADAYLAARDRMVAEFSMPGASDKDQASALSYLERRLQSLVPPWQAPGFSAKAVINLASLTPDDAGYGQLDGLRYASVDASAVVTTPPLLKHWLAEHRAWWPGKESVPQVAEAAFHSEAFYTQAVSPDAAMSSYGELPVPGKNAVIQLAVFSQDLTFDTGPDTIVVAAVRGDRVFVAQQKLAIGTKPVAVCQAAMKQALAQSEAEMNAYGASRLKDRASFDRHVALEEKADRDYRHCFARHLPEQPVYAAIVKQAQALAEQLH